MGIGAEEGQGDAAGENEKHAAEVELVTPAEILNFECSTYGDF